MVVVLIIGILIAIALPTFLGARQRAQDKAAASDLRNGFAAAKVFFTDSDTYSGFQGAGVAAGIEPNLTWQIGGDPGNTGALSIVEPTAALPNTVDLVRKSDSGTYFCAGDTGGAGAGVHKGSDYASVNDSAKCGALPKV